MKADSVDSVRDFSVSVVYKSVPPLIASKTCQQQVKYVSCSSILHFLCSSKGKGVREPERKIPKKRWQRKRRTDGPDRRQPQYLVFLRSPEKSRTRKMMRALQTGER
jgi:hypothetical protein